MLIFADDLGYGDLSCYGSPTTDTPNLDALAGQGTRFTDFYVSQAVCTASRASLMTGCYANRVGLAGALNHTSTNGIDEDEQLLPELLKQAGYATAIYGKWHLGTIDRYNPVRHGFDEYFGIPYSNDNTKYHPVLADEMPPLPLYEGKDVIETDPDQRLFTRRITEHATSFIDRHREQPFFLYVPHVMPHVPVFASDEFSGRTGRGIYADVIAEIDWSVGEILAALDRHGLAESTIVIFTSDNGPFLSYGTHAGSAGPLREGKLTAYEGGVRVPCIARWPGQIPAGQISHQPWMSIDLLPTLTAIADAPQPERTIDGVNVRDVLTGGKADTDRTLLFFSGEQLHAVRRGPWKLHLPHDYITVNGTPGTDGKPAGYAEMEPKSITESGVKGIASRHGYRVEQQPLALYDLGSDPEEQIDVRRQHRQIADELQQLAENVEIEPRD